LHLTQELQCGLIRALIHLAEGLDQCEGLLVKLGEQVQHGLDLPAEVVEARLSWRVNLEFRAGLVGDSRWCAHTKETSEQLSF